MTYVILVTVLLLIQYTFFSFRAGSARGKVKAPAMTGDEDFERKSRVHLNTLEQLMITIPTMWICAAYFRADVAAILGTVFLVGRFVYSAAYIKDPSSRTAGMLIGFLANMLLILCCLYVVVMRLI